MPKLNFTDTVEDVLPSLDHPEKYLRGMVGNMVACHKQHGDAYVAIGTSGKGVAPHYRVAPSDDVLDEAIAEDRAPFNRAFHGRNHKLLPWGEGQLRGVHWSARSMSYEQIRELLGKEMAKRKAR